MVLTLTQRINFAKRITREASELKGWRIRNKKNRVMWNLAKDLTAGKGYIIATAKEMQDRYGDLIDFSTSNPRKEIWCIFPNWLNSRLFIQFAAI